MAHGAYFDPTPPHQHRCDLPVHADRRGWRCECGRAYVQEWLPSRDVNPGERPWQWRRSLEHDVGDPEREPAT